MPVFPAASHAIDFPACAGGPGGRAVGEHVVVAGTIDACGKPCGAGSHGSRSSGKRASLKCACHARRAGREREARASNQEDSFTNQDFSTVPIANVESRNATGAYGTHQAGVRGFKRTAAHGATACHAAHGGGLCRRDGLCAQPHGRGGGGGVPGAGPRISPGQSLCRG